MPPNPNVTVVRPDGSTLQATREEAEKLKVLGYKEQTPEELISAAGESARETFFGNQVLETVAEGFNRGWSLGLTDYTMGDEDTANRAKYNPGISTAAELTGAVGAEFIPGLNAVAPAALVGKGARAAVKGTGIVAKTVRGAAEGAVFGGAMAADHAYLAGDPVTSEAVLHGVGWGTIFGAGLSAAGAGLAARGEAKIAAGTKLEAEAAAAANLGKSKVPTYESLTEPTVTTIPAKDLEAHGFQQLPGLERGARLDKARAAIREGQREPIEAVVGADGTVEIANGRHRLAAAMESGADIQVKWERGRPGSAGVERIGGSIEVREAALAQEAAALRQQEATARAGGQRFEATPGSYEAAATPAYTAFKAETKAMSKQIKESVDTVEAILSNNRKKIAELGITGEAMGPVARSRFEVQSAFKRFSKALNKKGFTEEKLAKATQDFNNTMAKTLEKSGLAASPDAQRAIMEYAEMKILQKELSKFPQTAAGFANMNGDKAERLFAALSAAKGMSKFPAMAQALEGQANKLQEALGLTPNGVDGLRAAYNIAKKQMRAEKSPIKFTDIKSAKAALNVRSANLQAEKVAKALEEARNLKAPTPEYEPGLVRKGFAYGAGAATYKLGAMTGHPWMAMGAASRVKNFVLGMGAPRTPELVAARNATLGRIKKAVGGFQVKSGKAVQTVSTKVSPLALRLDGSIDTSTKDPSQLAYNRIRDFSEASVHVKNTLFRGIEPIAVEQPELGPALHQAGVATFEAFRALLPADPGVVSGLKSIWKPSSLQAAVMSRQLSVWQDPVSAAEEMLASNIFDPIRVKTLKTVAPAVYEQLRVEMIGRIQEPGFLDNVGYKDQVALGTILEIPIHSSMRPEFIAASQQLHTNRSQPLPTPAMPGSTNGGRPAGDTPGATAAQISTSR